MGLSHPGGKSGPTPGDINFGVERDSNPKDKGDNSGRFQSYKYLPRQAQASYFG